MRELDCSNSGVLRRLGNGATVKFWTNCWTQLGRLANFATKHLVVSTLQQTATSYYTDQGWNLPLLQHHLPPHILNQIMPYTVSSSSEVHDGYLRKHSSLGG